MFVHLSASALQRAGHLSHGCVGRDPDPDQTDMPHLQGEGIPERGLFPVVSLGVCMHVCVCACVVRLCLRGSISGGGACLPVCL